MPWERLRLVTNQAQVPRNDSVVLQLESFSFPDRRMATPQFSEEQMVYIQEHFVPRAATSSVATTNDPSPPVPPTAGTSTVSGELGRATATASLLGF